MEVHAINYLKIVMIYFAMNSVVNNLVNKIAIFLLHDDPQIWGQKINFCDLQICGGQKTNSPFCLPR